MSSAKLSLLLGCIALLGNGCGPTAGTPSPLPTTRSPQSRDAESEAKLVAAFAAPPEPAALALDDYLDLHRTLLKPRSLAWSAAVKSLTQQGDFFTIHVTQELLKSELLQEQTTSLREMESSIRSTRVSVDISKTELARLLKTAAYADVTCHWIEQDLTRWTHLHVSGYCHDAKVREELQRFAQEYRSDFSNVLLRKGVELRVREYARSLLAEPALTE